MVQLTVLIIILLFFAVTDYRKGELSLVLLLSSAVLGIVINILIPEMSFLAILLGIILGGCFFLISLLSRQALGYGDSLLLLVIGCFAGAEAEVLSALLGFAAVGIYAGIKKLISLHGNKTGKKAVCSLPFVPFLLTGYVMCLGVCL